MQLVTISSLTLPGRDQDLSTVTNARARHKQSRTFPDPIEMNCIVSPAHRSQTASRNFQGSSGAQSHGENKSRVPSNKVVCPIPIMTGAIRAADDDRCCFSLATDQTGRVSFTSCQESATITAASRYVCKISEGQVHERLRQIALLSPGGLIKPARLDSVWVDRAGNGMNGR
ncbi:hypothetical protein RRG08_013823 [Elysia crispata]|uniref:Uncharacterized protein n=1 Tax=Elysia crispata TaxID=231223 RepID=A0AAE1BBU2_9GAST|nr:hypothetical protein RRG08_013823 [Elysia crispata]